MARARTDGNAKPEPEAEKARWRSSPFRANDTARSARDQIMHPRRVHRGRRPCTSHVTAVACTSSAEVGPGKSIASCPRIALTPAAPAPVPSHHHLDETEHSPALWYKPRWSTLLAREKKKRSKGQLPKPQLGKVPDGLSDGRVSALSGLSSG